MAGGRRVVVTGAGSGLGWAVAHRFVELGDRVLAVDQFEDRLEKFAAEHPGVDTVTADVGTTAGADAVADAAGDRVDVLVNNAGILDRLALIDEADDDLFDQVIASNLRGPFIVSHRVVPKMLAAGGGVIVSTASVAGLRGSRAGAAYTASKWGLVGLTQNIAATFREQHIRCVAVCPAGMNTQIGMGQDISERGWALVQSAERVPAVEPDVVAKVVVFLASDDAEHINGVALPVDGGSIAS
ncbi:MAG TPA: SDR family oxidoreductase [Acidimicrobiales bacterium]|nr:SDR family oxidoreductase [Acidimicrobiales bacterium]